MDIPDTSFSTGLPELDTVLQKIFPGDNIVWQVDSIEAYIPFVEIFTTHVIKNNKKIIYFRFASHRELVEKKNGVITYTIDPLVGFETFTTNIRKIIHKYSEDSCFVFDCLSDLPVHWYSDLMLGNFFVLICPYILQHKSLAYFSLIRYRHSLSVAAHIRQTTQILIDVYKYNNDLYIHPLKVDQRHSPTMYLPHIREDDSFRPVTDSATVSKVVSTVRGSAMDTTPRILDVWDRTFIEARDTINEIADVMQPTENIETLFNKLLRMVISTDDRVLSLAKRYLTIEDIFEIKKRLIGTGKIGGKSAGMLIARAILRKNDERWNELLEVHDSFYIGSDVFYTFIVLNDCWEERHKHRDPETFLDGVEEACSEILNGIFPQYILDQFVEMFDYFGQTPIIVRSSSLLEDNFGNAFSGKYESVFCVNQGNPGERLEAFLRAVRKVYASTLSKEALMYRFQRGLLDRDEQMALLVQRVSGSVFGNLFFPLVAGVGLSYNPYSWSKKIDPESGVLRIVCGLGTRAVDRHDDDYTRVVALNAPQLSPEKNFDKFREFAQKQVDVLDVEGNEFRFINFNDMRKTASGFPAEIISSPVYEDTQVSLPYHDYWILTFKKLLSETTFVANMRDMLTTLQKAYEYPVDTEFTVNFKNDGSYQINLLQCRPLQMVVKSIVVEPPRDIDPKHIIIEANGAIIGPSVVTRIEQIIYVVPSEYEKMREQERYAVARLIGRVTHLKQNSPRVTMLIGPGRWGTSMASLGVPVTFGEINTASVICEIMEMNENLIPDVSLGTHFFNDIVETKMLYIAVFPHLKESVLNKDFLEKSTNQLPKLFPDQTRFSDVIRVIDTVEFPIKQRIILNANTFRQRVVCYIVET